jgi:predicted ATPase
MKLSKIQINDYAQFKNLTLDFTYTTGDRKGQPLEKICLVGQSGTGKTTLLNLITSLFDAKFRKKHLVPADEKNSVIFMGKTESNPRKNLICNINGGFFFGDSFESPTLQSASSWLNKEKRHVIFISSEILNSEKSILNSIPNKKEPIVSGKIQTSTSIVEADRQRKNRISTIEHAKSIVISSETEELIWECIISDILDYDEKVKMKGAELIQKGAYVNMKRFIAELDEWKVNNPNPREIIAQKCLNPILRKFNLEMDQEVSTYPVVIKPINENISIPSNGLSTGTRQFILSSLPIFKLAEPSSIICIDEPERSLFPDLQMEIVPYYINMSPKSQFIVATHSPLIAACFEPDERFIFSFDNTGHVCVTRGSAPLGDDPNDLLKKDFGLDSLMNIFGVEMYQKYLALKTEISQELDPLKKKELILKAAKIGDDYNFET